MTDKNPEKLNLMSNTSSFCIAKGDTGATSHYWTDNDKEIPYNIKKNKRPSCPTTRQYNNICNRTGGITLVELIISKSNKNLNFTTIKSANLISLGQLCDDGCTITLNRENMKVTKNNTTILKGIRNRKDGLWDIPIPKTSITKNCCIQPSLHGGLYKKKASTTKPSIQHISKKTFTK